MARKGKIRQRELSLEEQLREHDANEVRGDPVRFKGIGGDEGHLIIPNDLRVEWARKRAEIVARIRKRDSIAMADPGKNASGHFDVPPYVARGHLVDTAPRDLRASPDSQFPKRIATQRVIDRYRAHGHISEREWKAANFLWSLWCEAGSNARMASAYDPVMVSSSPDMGGTVAKRLDAAAQFVALMAKVPYRSAGCVRAVVIEDWSASQWARGRGYTRHDSEAHGLKRLRPGLSALADSFGY